MAHTKTFNLRAKGVFSLSAGFLTLFVFIALFDLEFIKIAVDTGFTWAIKFFGAYWQTLLFLTFVIGLFITLSPASKEKLGGVDTPEMSTFQWISIIMCTLLAGGGVFWAAGEPMAHFLNPPPLYDVEGGTAAAVYPALAQSYMHWGFLAWAILAALTTPILMYYHYDKGFPLLPRTLLYPVFGDKVINGPLGVIVDSCCVIAVVAGTVGPIGFLGLQVSYGLAELFGFTDNMALRIFVILLLTAIYTISAISGITRGIQILSKFNIVLGAFLLIFILLFGPTAFIVDSFVQSMATYLQNFMPMSLFRADTGWLGWWTVFFWGWFLGYGPLMAMFVSKISRGRSIRQIILTVSLVAPVLTCMWFTIIGGAGIAFELQEAGTVSKAFEGFNLPAALLAITQNLPMGFIVSILFLILTTIFVATTGDSMTYTISMVMSGNGEPNMLVRIFWGLAMGAVAIILVMVGDGSSGVDALQKFIVVTAVPVSLILLPPLWIAPTLVGKIHAERQLQRQERQSNQYPTEPECLLQ
ncbi:MAG: BCCT family transporter [Gammaproteobacteria bacterium]|nr:BCCT family transporter [Gammaproteobacteria bacterium]